MITINLTKAKAQKLAQYNSFALEIAATRGANTIAGLPNSPDDATWSAALTAGRDAIASATTTAELIAIPNP